MNDPLTLGAAWLLGLGASGHCLLMCGGVSTALGIATAKNAQGRPRTPLLIAHQLGRIVSYTLAGALFAGVLGGVIALLDRDSVRLALRVLAACAFVLAALVAFGRVHDPGRFVGQRVWGKLAPLGRRLLPIATLPRALAFGMIWGWMPCGFVYTVLLIATVQLDALRGAETMAAFGLGTAPALLATAFGAQRFLGWTTRPVGRKIAGFALTASAILTLAGPWLIVVAPGLHAFLPFDCTR
ncbi:MAG: sulfite exporter TauE/SafE family protein [Proteobacteria bacterium]|nr:sulfite exporter TauE/SafE family protein [Pseudomonadota bacterium]